MFQPGLASFTFVCLFVKFTIASSGHQALGPRGGQLTRHVPCGARSPLPSCGVFTAQPLPLVTANVT